MNATEREVPPKFMVDHSTLVDVRTRITKCRDGGRESEDKVSLRTESKEMNAAAGSRNVVDASGKERMDSSRNRLRYVKKKEWSHLRAGTE